MDELVSVNAGMRDTYDVGFATAGRTGDGHVLVVLWPGVDGYTRPDDAAYFAMKPETALFLMAALKRCCKDVCGEAN